MKEVFNTISISLRKIILRFKLRTFKRSNIHQLFFFPSFQTGGAEKVHADIVKAVGNRNSTIVFFTDKSINKHYWNSFSENAKCIDISNVYQNSYLRTYFLELMTKMISKKNISVIVFGSNNYLFYQVIKIISNFKNVNCIDLIHAFSKPDRGIEDESVKFIQYLDKRITISEKTKKDLTFQYEEQSLIGDYVERIEVIPNGISLNKIKSRKKTEIKNVLFLGRDSKEKNFELFIELAKLCPNCNFWALGPSKRDKLPNNLKCMGVVSSENEKQKWLQKCDALIVTSYREGFPISIMEAMAFGLVVISTNVGAISEHILNSKNGYLVNLRESNKDIAIEMAEIINKSSTNQINDISRNAIDYARKNFDIENFNQKYRTLFSR